MQGDMRDGFNLQLGRASYCSLKMYLSFYSIFIFVIAVLFVNGQRQNGILGPRLEYSGLKFVFALSCVSTNLGMAATARAKSKCNI